jgi:hypothetical protein
MEYILKMKIELFVFSRVYNTHFEVKIRTQLKSGYMKFRSETKKCVKFHSEAKQYFERVAEISDEMDKACSTIGGEEECI